LGGKELFLQVSQGRAIILIINEVGDENRERQPIRSNKIDKQSEQN
jgi:hypothetical protein